MKNKNIKNKPKKCGRWLFLHSGFSKIFWGWSPVDPRTPLIKGIYQLHLQNLSSTTTTTKGTKKKKKKKKKEPESSPPLKQSTRNLSLGYREIEKKAEGTRARSFLCDL